MVTWLVIKVLDRALNLEAIMNPPRKPPSRFDLPSSGGQDANVSGRLQAAMIPYLDSQGNTPMMHRATVGTGPSGPFYATDYSYSNPQGNAPMNYGQPQYAPQFPGQALAYPALAYPYQNQNGALQGSPGCDPNILACLFRPRTGPRRQHLGITETSIPVAGSVSITLTPNSMFLPQELRIPSDIIVAGLSIANITVGGRTQLAGGAVPARIFSEVSQDAYFDCDPVSPSQGIVVTVANTSGAIVVFRGAFIGTSQG